MTEVHATCLPTLRCMVSLLFAVPCSPNSLTSRCFGSLRARVVRTQQHAGSLATPTAFAGCLSRCRATGMTQDSARSVNGKYFECHLIRAVTSYGYSCIPILLHRLGRQFVPIFFKTFARLDRAVRRSLSAARGWSSGQFVSSTALVALADLLITFG